MKIRAFHPAGFVSSYLSEANNLVERCLIKLWKHILPTLLILICSSVITLFLSGLIDQAKLDRGATAVTEKLSVMPGEAGKLP
jgi:hypothetical protein